MKYIVCKLAGKEVIFVFPKAIDHDRFYEGLTAIRIGSERKWERYVLGCPDDLVSAGFVTVGKCHGRSETLGVESRGALDTQLLQEAQA